MVLRVRGGDCVFAAMMIATGSPEFGSVDCGVIHLARRETAEAAVACVLVPKLPGEIQAGATVRNVAIFEAVCLAFIKIISIHVPLSRAAERIQTAVICETVDGVRRI